MTTALRTYSDTVAELHRIAYGPKGQGPVSLLSIAFAGIQDQVKIARTTRDSWNGSYLISHLSATAVLGALEQIARSRRCSVQEVVGNCLLPSLVPPPLSETSSVGVFPNQALLAIPGGVSEADELGKASRAAAAKRWEEIVAQCENVFKPGIGKTQWDYQTRFARVFEFYWSCVEVPADEDVFESTMAAHSIPPGSDWTRLNIWAGRALGSRKMTRSLEQMGQEHRRCTLCGERSALSNGPQYKNLTEYWEGVLIKLPFRFRRHERLCAVCTVKRLAPSAAMREYTNGRVEFPSTSSIAAARSIRDLFHQAPDPGALVRATDEWVSWLRDSVEFPYANILPYFEKDPTTKGAKLLEIDADLLFEETYSRKGFDKECRCEPEKAAALRDAKPVNRLQEKLQALNVKFKPGTYYVVLVADGDEMGEWIVGRHGRYQGEFSITWQKSLSDALRQFAGEARKIVEEHVPGKLVYAGGDDLLAFIPVEDMLEVVRNLQAAWRRELENVDGAAITLSFGCRIAHHSDALTEAMEEAHENLKEEAKRHYARNAFAVSRSTGGGKVTGARLASEILDDLITLQDSMRTLLGPTREGLSGHITYALAEFEDGLRDWKLPVSDGDLDDAREACIRRAFGRQSQFSGTQEQKNAKRKIIEDAAVRLYRSLKEWSTEVHESPTKELFPREEINPFEQFVNLLAMLRFITRPE